MRIALIHALKHAIAPIEASFARLWPEAVLANPLPADLARDGELTPAMGERFLTLARYAAATDADADGILFTGSAFGPCIGACARALPHIPVLTPNEAMIEEAAALVARQGKSRGKVVPLTSFAPTLASPTLASPTLASPTLASPTLASIPAEFAAVAPQLEVVNCLAEGALAAIDRGDGAEHDQAAARAAAAWRDVDVIALGQFSLTRAEAAVTLASARPILTTPDILTTPNILATPHSAKRKVRRMLTRREAA